MDEQVASEEKTYRLSRAGRRMAYLLMAGGVLIWLFALWTLKNTLKIGLRPQNLLPSLKLLGRRLIGLEGAPPLTVEEAIPAIVMLVLAIIVPLLIWNLVEELRASFTVSPAGLTFRSLGVELNYAWNEVVDLHPVDEEAEEPLDELIVRPSRLASISSPIVRFLHWQAYGRHKIPLYSGLEGRGELLAYVHAHMAAPGEPGATAPAEAEEETGEGTVEAEPESAVQGAGEEPHTV